MHTGCSMFAQSKMLRHSQSIRHARVPHCIVHGQTFVNSSLPVDHCVSTTKKCALHPHEHLVPSPQSTQLPERAQYTKLVEVFDALELESTCGVTRPIPTGAVPPPSIPIPSGPGVFFVDPSGDDTHAGTESAPFATVGRAVAATRSATAGPKAVVLRKGTHFLGTESVKLTAADSGLLITNYPGEEAWVSGGVPLKTSWQR